MRELLKKMIKRKPKLYFKMRLIRKISPSLYIINFFFQRILRRHSKLDFSVNFTSQVSGIDITYSRDFFTLTSFAISGNCYFQAINGIRLGKNFLCAPGVRLISANHLLSDLKLSEATDPIIIGDDCWIGANSIVLPGVRIGNGCVIGAGSVVTKSFGDGLVIAGNPAKVLKKVHD
jgi:acetyltransferase-like isoleucine patch superfamily enzyme